MLLLYAYCVGTVSSRKIERACYQDLAFRVLTGNQQPDHSRISDFRRRNLDALLEAELITTHQPSPGQRLQIHFRADGLGFPEPHWYMRTL